MEIRRKGILYQGTIVRKNQPEVSKKVVSISRVLTVFATEKRFRNNLSISGNVITDQPSSWKYSFFYLQKYQCYLLNCLISFQSGVNLKINFIFD